VKIAYCGYDFFHACLGELIQQGHEILRVFSFESGAAIDSHDYVKNMSRDANVPFTLEKLNTRDLEILQKKQCELVLTAGYPHKIPDLTEFGMRGLNIHPSLLPQGRGVWPLPWLILKALNKSGVTLHQLSPQWDAGDILLQGEFELSDRDNLESLSAKCQILATQLLRECVDNFDHYWENAAPQAATDDYWPYPPAHYRYINWQWPIERIDRTCRAYGKAGAIASFADRTWLVYDMVSWNVQHSCPCGSVVHKTNTEMIIAASDGLCSLRYFSPAPADVVATVEGLAAE